MITLERQTIPAEDARAIAQRVSESLIGKGAPMRFELEVRPHPRGLLVAADFGGTPVAVMCWSYNLIDYDTVADALLIERQKGLEPAFPDDADIIGIHRNE